MEVHSIPQEVQVRLNEQPTAGLRRVRYTCLPEDVMFAIVLLSVGGSLALAEDVEADNARFVRRKPRATSMLLYDMMADADATQQIQLRYWMAESFQRIELFHTAQRYYLAVVDGGESRWREDALIALVALSEAIGDDADLLAMAAALDPADFPAPVASELHYLQGTSHHADGSLSEAAASYRSVRYATPRYFTARLALAVALSESGETTAARDVLVDLIRTEPTGTRLEKQDARDVQALALLDLARLYYAAGRYEEAAKLYGQVSHDTPWRAKAELERGWAALLLGDHTAAMSGGVLSSSVAYLPEGALLAASAALQAGGCSVAMPVLDDFLTAYQPAHDELVGTGRMSGAEQWDWWFGEDVTGERALPAAFFSRLLRDQPLAGAIYRMDQIAWERTLAESQSPEWVSTVGEG
ncbi:MAG: tetratricopeptide (TPR) repeat protein, partial [Myxococcota bacterium]